MSIPKAVDLRDQLTDKVVRDLLGPAGGPDEELHRDEDHVYPARQEQEGYGRSIGHGVVARSRP